MSRPPPTLKTEYVPPPTVEIGEYVTHRSPTARSADTLLGKVMGYLSELLFWADIEGKCRFIDAIVPEVFIIGEIDNLFIQMFRNHYNANYQKQYNRGADQGNKFHQAIFGWIDEAKSNLLGIIDETRRKIERDLINPLKAKIKDEVEPIVNDLLNRVKTAESTIRDAENRINQALGDVSKLKDNVASLNRSVNTVKSDLEASVRNFQSKMNKLDIRLNNANTDLTQHTKDIRELFEKVKELEGKVSDQGSSLDWFKGQVQKVLP